MTALLQQSAVWRFGPSIFGVLRCGRCLKRAAMWPLYSACGYVAAVFSALLSSQHSAAGCSSSTELKKMNFSIMNFQLFIFYPSAVLPLSAVMPLSPRPLRCSCLITLRISSRSCINPPQHPHAAASSRRCATITVSAVGPPFSPMLRLSPHDRMRISRHAADVSSRCRDARTECSREAES